MSYEKPVILSSDGLAEGVFMASGTKTETTPTKTAGIKCDSIYMKGVWKGQDWSNWQGTMYEVRGCEGCPANWGDRCHIETYTDDLDFRPSWEVQGHKPEDPCQ